MKISFIVPAYNVENYINQCIDSVLNQRLENYPETVIEAIVINDGSKDKTIFCLEKYKDDSRVILINKENEGVSKARNIGIDVASGDYLFFLDGDDVVDQKLVEYSLPCLEKRIDLCFIEHFEWNKEDKLPVNDHPSKEIQINKEDFKEFKKATFNRDINGKYDYHKLKMATPCKFYSSRLIKNHMIQFPENVKTGEDAIFNFQVYQIAENASYIPKPLYFHRLIDSSVSHKYNPDSTRNFDVLHSYLKKFVNSDPDLELYYAERCLWSIGFCCLLDFLAKDNPKSYRERKHDFSQYRNKYLKEIKSVHLRDYRLKKRIMLLLIRNDCFFILDKIAKIGLVK